MRALLESGMSVAAVARQLGASRNTVAQVRDGGVERRQGYERANSARPAQLVEDVRQKIAEDPHTSIGALAGETGTAPSTMRRLVEEEIGCHSYAIQRRQVLTDDSRRKRRERCAAMINDLKRRHAGKVILFQDEKFFTLAQYHNRRNSKVIVPKSDDFDDRRIIGVAQRPAGVMFFGVVASNGLVAPPIFVDPGLKINAPAYQDLLLRELKPWVDANFAPGSFVYQHDGAPAHTAHSTQDFLDELGWTFWRKSEWPPHSPDLAPMDYGIWDAVQCVACAEASPDIPTLRAKVAQAWLAQAPTEVRKVARIFRRRLEACVAAQGGYIEKD